MKERFEPKPGNQHANFFDKIRTTLGCMWSILKTLGPILVIDDVMSPNILGYQQFDHCLGSPKPQSLNSRQLALSKMAEP